MSEFKVNLTAINPVDRKRRTPPVEALVDTGSHSSWLPRQLLLDAGIKPEAKVQFEMANRQIIERDLGYAMLTANVNEVDAGYTTIDEIVFAEDGDMSLLGVRTLEGFRVMADNIGQRLVATTALVPANTSHLIPSGAG